RAMVHVGQQRVVPLAVLLPVGPVRVRHVQVVALVAPALGEDLFVLLLRLEVHPQRRVQAARALLRRIAIRVDEEEARAARFGRAAASPTAAPAGAAPRAIEPLPSA